MSRAKIILHKASSFAKARAFDEKYYVSRTPSERLSDVQFCREQYFKMHKFNANRKRLQRVVRVIKHA